jgi:hypothetical protein
MLLKGVHMALLVNKWEDCKQQAKPGEGGACSYRASEIGGCQVRYGGAVAEVSAVMER